MLNITVLAKEFPVIEIQLPNQEALKKYLKQKYTKEPVRILDNKSVGVTQAVLISNELLKLGFKNASSLEGKFTNDGFANPGEAQGAKELCESIAFVVSTLSPQNREKVMRFVADRQLLCGSGTINNLQEIYKIVSGQSQNIGTLVAEAKREVIHNIIMDLYRPNSKHRTENIFSAVFRYSDAMETHYVPRIANAIKDEFGLTEESDHYSKNLNPSRYKAIILDAVNHKLSSDGIISAVINRVLLSLPSENSTDFKVELEEYLKILGIGVIEDFIVEESGKLRPNLDEHLRNVMAVYFASGLYNQKLEYYIDEIVGVINSDNKTKGWCKGEIKKIVEELGVEGSKAHDLAEKIYDSYTTEKDIEKRGKLRDAIKELVKKKFTLLDMNKDELTKITERVNHVRHGMVLSEQQGTPDWKDIITNRIKVQKDDESELVDSLQYALENDIEIDGKHFVEYFIEKDLMIEGQSILKYQGADGNNIFSLICKFSKSDKLFQYIFKDKEVIRQTALDNSYNKDGDSLLSTAIKSSNTKAIDVLLSKNSSVIPLALQRIPLKQRFDYLEKALLAAAGVNLELYEKIYNVIGKTDRSRLQWSRDANGYTVLQIAAKKGNKAVIAQIFRDIKPKYEHATQLIKMMQYLAELEAIRSVDDEYNKEFLRVYSSVYNKLEETPIKSLNHTDIKFLSILASTFKSSGSSITEKLFSNVVTKLSPDQTLKIIEAVSEKEGHPFVTWDNSLLLKFEEILSKSKMPEKFVSQLRVIKQVIENANIAAKLAEQEEILNKSGNNLQARQEAIKNIILYLAGISDVGKIKLTATQVDGLSRLVHTVKTQNFTLKSLDPLVSVLVGLTATPTPKWYSGLSPQAAHLTDGNQAFNDRSINTKAWDDQILRSLDLLSKADNFNKAQQVFSEGKQPGKKMVNTLFGAAREWYYSSDLGFRIALPLAMGISFLLISGFSLLLTLSWVTTMVLGGIYGVVCVLPPLLCHLDKIAAVALVIPEAILRIPIAIVTGVVISIGTICNEIPVVKDYIGFKGSFRSIMGSLMNLYTVAILYRDEKYEVGKNEVMRTDLKSADIKQTTIAPFIAQELPTLEALKPIPQLQLPEQQPQALVSSLKESVQQSQKMQQLLDVVSLVVDVPRDIKSTTAISNTEETSPVITGDISHQITEYREKQQKKFNITTATKG